MDCYKCLLKYPIYPNKQKVQNKFMIETISNPQQSWGDSWTQGAINVVSN